MKQLKARIAGIVTLMATIIAGIGIMAYVPVHAEVTSWSELQAALNATGTVNLTQNITASSEDGPLVVPEGVTVTLELNGYKINRGLYDSTMTDKEEIDQNSKANGSVIVVKGTLILTDSSDKEDTSEYDGTGMITGGNIDGSGGGVRIDKGGSFTMEGGTISENYSGGGGGAGAGIYVNGTFVMIDGTIKENVCCTGGGGVCIGYNGAFTMKGGMIIDNTVDGMPGGGVVIVYTGTFTMEGGTISGNTASSGGGVYVYGNEDESGTFIISGNVKITDNKCGDTTENVSLETGTIKVAGPLTDGAEIGITDSKYSENGIFAEGYNGYTITSDDISHFSCDVDENKKAALSVDGKYVFIINKNGWGKLQNALINASEDSTAPTEIKLDEDIVASQTDGALTVLSGKYVTLDLNGHTIDRGLYDSTMTDEEEINQNNKANGSVIVVKGTLILTDSSDNKDTPEYDGTGMITGGNIAGSGGGVLVDDGGSFTMEGGTISENTVCGGYGAGICVYGTFVMIDGTIKENVCGTGGGGVCIGHNGAFTMKGGMIIDNTGGGMPGGGVVIEETGTFTMEGGTISGNTASSGGGVYVYGNEDESGTFIISGNVKIIDNKKGDTTENVSWDTETIKVAGPLTDDAEIGITIDENYESDIIAEGYGDYIITSDDLSHFICDTDNKVAVLNDEGKVVFVEKQTWNWLQEQFDYASEDSTEPTVITLNSDITPDEYDNDVLVIHSDRFVTLDLNGHTINRGLFDSTMTEAEIEANQKLYGSVIEVFGSLTLKDSSDNKDTPEYDGTGKITGGNSNIESGYCGGVVLFPDAKFIMEGGTISENRGAYGGVCASTGATFTMKDGTISGNIGYDVGGVCAFEDVTFIMEDGTISGNIGDYIGGVGLFRDATFIMEGGIISGNVSSVAGGGVYVSEDCTFTMKGGKISGNVAPETGGGVYVSDDCTFTMKGGKISGNEAETGGGVYVYGNATFTMEDGTISENEAEYGGGVYADMFATFTMEGGTISENEAADGGGVYVGESARFAIEDGKISGNIASENGGGVYVLTDGEFDLLNGTVSENIATVGGGGVYVLPEAAFDMKGGSIINNICDNYLGGGIYSCGTLFLSGNIVIANNKIEDENGQYDCNLYLNKSIIFIFEKLTGTTPIGVKGFDYGLFAEGWNDLTSEDLAAFKSENDSVILGFNETEKKLYLYYDLSKAEISISDMTYTGDEIEPDITITFDIYDDESNNESFNLAMNQSFDDYFTVSYADNIEVGTATVTVTGVPDMFAGTVQTTFEITPKPVIVSLEVSDKVYDGTTDATVTGTPVIDGVIENEVVSLLTGTAQFSDKNVGTDKTVTFSGYSLTGEDAGNYVLTTQPASVTANITRASATVKAVNGSKAYGDADPTLEATVTGVLSGDTINYSLSRVEGEDVGEYEITVTLGENPNYDVTVENAVFTITSVKAKETTAPVAGTFTYNGEEQGLVTEGVADTAMEYSLDGTNFSSDIPKKKDVGTYTVYYRAAADDNHSAGTVGSVEAKINPADVTVTAKNTGKAVGDADPELGAEVTGLISSDTVSYNVSRESGEEIGTYAIKVTGEAVQGNYNVTYVNGTFTIAINKIVPTVTLGNDTIVYDGTEKTPTVKVTFNDTELSTDDYTVSYTNNKNAGNATVTVSAKAGSDYTFEDVTKSFVISKADAPASKPQNVMNVTSDCEKLSDVALIEGWSWQDSETVLVEGQETSAVAVYTGEDSDNYVNISVTIKVNRAENENNNQGEGEGNNQGEGETNNQTGNNSQIGNNGQTSNNDQTSNNNVVNNNNSNNNQNTAKETVQKEETKDSSGNVVVKEKTSNDNGAYEYSEVKTDKAGNEIYSKKEQFIVDEDKNTVLKSETKDKNGTTTTSEVTQKVDGTYTSAIEVKDANGELVSSKTVNKSIGSDGSVTIVRVDQNAAAKIVSETNTSSAGTVTHEIKTNFKDNTITETKTSKTSEKTESSSVITGYTEADEADYVILKTTDAKGKVTKIKLAIDRENNVAVLVYVKSESTTIAIPNEVVAADGKTYPVKTLTKGLISKKTKKLDLGVKPMVVKAGALKGRKNISTITCSVDTLFGKNSLKDTKSGIKVKFVATEKMNDTELNELLASLKKMLKRAGAVKAKVYIVDTNGKTIKK